jgi:hypothetical protein
MTRSYKRSPVDAEGLLRLAMEMDVQAYTSCTRSSEKPCKECRHLAAYDLTHYDQQTSASAHAYSAERLRLKTLINQRHDVVASHLPPEISAHIFKFTLPVYSERHAHPSMSDDMLPVQYILGAVCQTWRHIVWTCPTLWTSLSFDVFSEGDKRDLVRQWLARSAHLPLSLHLYSDGFDYHQTLKLDDKISGLIDAINLHSARWHELCLSVPPKFMSHLSGNPTSTTSSLDRIRLRFIPENARPTKLSFHTQHQPVHLNVGSMPLGFIDFSWSRLTHMKAEGFSVSECIQLFQNARLLQEFQLRSFSSGRPTEVFIKPTDFVTHRHLRVLRILMPSFVRESGSAFLDCMAFPALTTYEHCFSGIEVPVAIILGLLGRSEYRVRQLSFNEPVFHDYKDLQQILKSTPRLEELSLCYLSTRLNLARPLLSELAKPTKTETFLPKLMALTLHTTQHFPWTLIPNLFGVPPQSGRPIKFLQMRLPDLRDHEIVDEAVVRRLLYLKQQGTTLDIKSLNLREDVLAKSATAIGLTIT